MNDILKEYIEAWSQRIRSPVLGYFIISYTALNWQELFYIIFSDESVSVRLRFFELRTSWQSLYLWPAVCSVVAALFLPWVNFIFSWATKEAILRSRQMQTSEAFKNELHKLRQRADLEDARAADDKAREDAKIAAAKRLEEVRSLNIPNLENEIIADRNKHEDQNNQYIIKIGGSGNLTPIQKDLIRVIGASESGLRESEIKYSKSSFSNYTANTKNITGHRFVADLNTALSGLSSLGVTDTSINGIIRLTSAGFTILDELP